MQQEVLARMPQFFVPPPLQGANDDDEHSKELLAKLGNALEEFRKAFPGQCPVSLIQTFLLVALNEGTTMKDITDRGEMKKSTASRALLDLAGYSDEGVKLIERRTHPTDLRALQYTLGPKGKRLIAKVVDILES